MKFVQVADGFKLWLNLLQFLQLGEIYFCTSKAQCYSSCDGVLIFVAEMKFQEQIHYCLPFVPPKMIRKTQAISILPNNIRDHAIRVGPHTAASEILVKLVCYLRDSNACSTFNSLYITWNSFGDRISKMCKLTTCFKTLQTVLFFSLCQLKETLM